MVLVLALVLFVGMPAGAVRGAGASSPGQTQVTPKDSSKSDSKEKEESLPQAAPHLVDFGPYQIAGKSIGPFSITSSMVVIWTVAILLIVFAQIATRNIQQVPRGAQNFWEWIVEALYKLLESIIGPKLVKKTFWFFATVFIFILATNWFGLIPGVGTIGWGHPDASGGLSHIEKPLMRGANADLNMTLAMAIIFFVCWFIWAIQEVGIVGFILHIFGPKGDMKGPLKLLMIVVFFAVGLLEVISIMFRPISLSFRLYGNVFAGENILEAMSTITRDPFWKYIAAPIAPIPFYFFELLVGLVQALVFMLLTSVFTLVICQHEEGEGKHH